MSDTRIEELEAALAHQTRCREDSDRKAMESDDALNATARQLAEAREDAARLDWCWKTEAMAVEWWQGGYRVVTHHNVWMTDVYETPRAAIDAARKGKP